MLLVDEAHDLSSNSQKLISEWWHAGKGKRYLILACDRHQKLRLLGDHATILEGVSFAGCSVRLSRNYRSPSPVYGAALALMFRWFAASGPKVMPNAGELTKAFGFSLDPTSPFPPASGGRVKLQLRNDCHPANYWSFTVARYRDFQTAYRWIEEWGLSQQQVLWVRFSHTDPYADHSSADRVQLRDLRVLEPDHVIDTHIKGREFPVVVIEGLPADLNSSDESSMLLWRRRLYLCAIPKPQVERREAQVKQLKREVVMTPRMISEHLGVKAFHILKTGLEIMKERRIPSMPQMDIALPEEVTARVYQRHNASLPDEADLQKLKRLVAATSAKR